MKKQHEKAIAAYESQCIKALDRLIAKIKPDLRNFCEKWGFDFYAGMGLWGVSFGGKYSRQKYKKIEGQYHLLGDPRFLMDFLNPELADTLDTSIGNQSLGSLIDNIEVSKEDYEWVVVKADAWCLDKETEIQPELITVVNELDPDYCYFGWLPKQIAEPILEEYNRDWDSGSQLLASLPTFLPEELRDRCHSSLVKASKRTA